ncbi:ATP-dependent zinc metalloprotease FtsH [Lamprobacter modestohalophilus]|uniref:ATP-dependent zinc metalloprotease FtsH n=1 Tax=Lamprobacter modestohalophilus TaxID=1064514 RepID=UPI002ADEC9B3|nr:ATP-dependent zinc metalloprotease FtsH [Lamprobacter modestohalophilus]MEA1052105.1 ATP-dependent zinc metalloprotease FtsH [Lamprobacter modestohalophilus]
MSSVEQQSGAKSGLRDRLKALRPDSGRTAQPGPHQPGGTPPWQNALYALIAIFALSTALSLLRSPGPQAISYTELKQAVRDGRVAQVTFEGQQVSGRFVEPEESQSKTDGAKDSTSGETSGETEDETQETSAATAKNGASAGAETGGDSESKAEAEADNSAAEQLGRRFISTLPQVQDPGLLDLLEQYDVEIDAESTETGLFGRVLITLLPWLLILGLFFYLSNRMQQRMMGGAGDGQGGGLFGIGKSKAKRVESEEVDTSLEEVAGLENAKADLQEIIDHLSDPQRFRALGAKLPKGVLLVGPPGTGKTLLARAVAGEAGVPFFNVSGSEFVEMFVGVGVGASRVRDLFNDAKTQSPCVLFIDEIDAIGRSRGTGMASGGGGNDEREQTLNQILNEMDGFSPHEDVVVLAATNRPDVLDNALLRPGRFDRKVYLELPDRDARHAILKIHAAKVVLGEDVDLERVAERTVGFSGADLENLVNEAALLAGRAKKGVVEMSQFSQARDKIVLGAEREQGIGDEERELVAYHESGHALLAWLLPNADQLDKVTIIPRGRALGATEQVPPEQRHTYRQGYLRDRIAVMLGGRIAEQVIFDEVTTGAEADLDQATELARRMVSRWGMSEAIGPVAFKYPDDQDAPALAMGARKFSDATAQRVDAEIKSLIDGIARDARQLVDENRDRLERLAKRLLEAETLSREQIDEVLNR